MTRSATARRRPAVVLTGSLAVALLALTACAPGDRAASSPTSTSPSPSTTSSPAAGASAADATPVSSVAEADRVDPTRSREVPSVSPRILLAHDGGLTLLDATTGETLKEQTLPGFLRLNAAGDGKDVLVTTEHGWEVFSTGIQSRVHGDHSHHYASEPGLTGVTFPGDHAGHVVTHHGRTTLFADGTGRATTFTSEHLATATPDLTPVTEEATTTAPHHGVALELSDGSLLTTQGTEESRDTVQVLDRETGRVRAETTDCPGVHGEAATAPTRAGDVVVLGCEDGPVVYRDGAFHKIAADGYVRNGNLAGLESSPVVLADRKVEGAKAEGEETERPTAVDLIDAHAGTVTTVELGSSYWFRSLARAEDGSAVVLTYDGELNVIDEETGEVVAEHPAIGAWREKDEWQQPGPILEVAGHTAYVTDAEQRRLVGIDLETGERVLERELDVAPVEMAVVTGAPESRAAAAGAASGEGDAAHDDHAHEGHSHEGDGGHDR